VSFEALKAMMLQVKVFWIVTPCMIVVGYQLFRDPLHPEDGSSMNFWNVGTLRQHYTVLQTRRTQL